MELHGVLYGVPRKTRRARIDELLKFVVLGDRRQSYVKEFSGGMKRQLEIARGFLHHPKITFSTNRRWAWIRKPAITCGNILGG